MTHPRRAARDPLKGAMPADRETRTHGILAALTQRFAFPQQEY
jgi:hypothetical protein